MRRYLLLAVMVIVGLFFVRQYFPMIEIPTKGRIEEEQQLLQSKMSDLAVQQKMKEDWENELVQLRGKASLFWVRVNQGMPVEQEVLEEFNRITRAAGVTIPIRESRPLKTPNVNYIQEVELRIEHRGVTMKDFSKLLREISRNRRKFHWISCTVNPDNIGKPTGVRVVGRLRAYVLTDEATRLLGSAPVEKVNELPKTAAPVRTTNVTRIERSTRNSTPPTSGLKVFGKQQTKGDVK